jgi:O-antigen ligase
VWHPGITALALCFVLGNVVYYLATGEVNRWGFFNKTVGLLVVMVSYAMVGAYASEGWHRVHRLARWFVLVVSAHALFATAVMALGLSHRLGVNWGGGLRLSGFLVDPNAFGGLLVSAFVIGLVIYFREGPQRRPLEGILTCSVLAVGTFLTYSRSCWIGLVGGMVLGFLLARARYRFLFVTAAVVVGVVVYFMIPVVLDQGGGQEAWEFSQSMAARQTPVTSRMELMSEGMKMFWQSPVWGRGLGYFQYGRGSIAIIHNTLVWILVEMGLIGATVFVWFIVGHLRRAWHNLRRASRDSRAVSIGLLCSFVTLAGFSLGIEALNQRHWWFVMALVSASYFLTRNDERQAALGDHASRSVPLQ